jgi:hypothetical protein
VPDDPQYCVPPVFGVPGVQAAPAASSVEASASPTLASAAGCPPSPVDPELPLDPEAPELPPELLPPELLEDPLGPLDPVPPVLVPVLVPLDEPPLLDELLPALASIAGSPFPGFELVPHAAAHKHDNAAGRANSSRRLRMATRLASSERIGVSSESEVEAGKGSRGRRTIVLGVEEFCSWRNQGAGESVRA